MRNEIVFSLWRGFKTPISIRRKILNKLSFLHCPVCNSHWRIVRPVQSVGTRIEGYVRLTNGKWSNLQQEDVKQSWPCGHVFLNYNNDPYNYICLATVAQIGWCSTVGRAIMWLTK